MTGQLIGSTVGDLLIRQLNESGIRPIATPEINVPDDARLRQIEADFYAAWRTTKDFCSSGIGFTMEAKADEAAIAQMNPGPIIEGDGEEELPSGDEDGELDFETPEAQY